MWLFLAELLYANCTWRCKLQRKELLEEEMWVILIFFYHLIVLSLVYISDIFIIFLSWVLFLHTGKNAKFTTSFSYGGVSCVCFFLPAFYFEFIFGLGNSLCVQGKKMSRKEKNPHVATLFHELKTIYRESKHFSFKSKKS